MISVHIELNSSEVYLEVVDSFDYFQTLLLQWRISSVEEAAVWAVWGGKYIDLSPSVWVAWLYTAPMPTLMPTLEASGMKGWEKFRPAWMGQLVRASFRLTKYDWRQSVQTTWSGWSFLVASVSGSAVSMQWGMNLLYYPSSPRKDLASFLVLVLTVSRTTPTLNYLWSHSSSTHSVSKVLHSFIPRKHFPGLLARWAYCSLLNTCKVQGVVRPWQGKHDEVSHVSCSDIQEVVQQLIPVSLYAGCRFYQAEQHHLEFVFSKSSCEWSLAEGLLGNGPLPTAISM